MMLLQDDDCVARLPEATGPATGNIFTRTRMTVTVSWLVTPSEFICTPENAKSIRVGLWSVKEIERGEYPPTNSKLG
jgi:hypothetical protein